MLLQNSGPSGTPLQPKNFAAYAHRRTHAERLGACQSRDPELVFILDGRWAAMRARRGEPESAVHRHAFWLARPHGTAELCAFAGEIVEALHIRMPVSLFSSIELEAGGAERRMASLQYESMFRDSLMEQMACAVAEDLESPTPPSAALLHSLIACMAARLLHRHVQRCVAMSEESKAKPVHEHRLSRVLRRIDENPGADLSIHALAQIACLSRFHFAKEFKRLTGRSPHKYISARRMRLASALLQENDRRLADVARACGFMTQASFNKAFMRSKGESPGEYRRAACADVMVRSPRAESKASPATNVGPVKDIGLQSRDFPFSYRLSVQSLAS